MLSEFKEYLIEEKKCSPHTVLSYTTDVQQFANFYQQAYAAGPEVPLYSAQHQDVRAWIIALLDEGMNSRTINRKLASLKAFFAFARQKGWVSRSPLQKIKPLKTAKHSPLFVDKEDMDRLREQVVFENNARGQRDRLIVEMLYNTGVRLSELLQLRPEDISFADNTLKVSAKGQLERIIPIPCDLTGLLKNYLQIHQGEYLISDEQGQQAEPVLVYRVLGNWLDQVSALDHKSPPVLRHNFAMHLLNKGADLMAVKELLGQHSLASVQVYTHYSVDKLKREFEQAHPKA